MLDVRDTPNEPRRRKRHHQWWVVGGVLAVLAGALVYSARDLNVVPDNAPDKSAKPPAANSPVESADPPVVDDLIDDDGKTLWASPTHGPPLDLANLPPGVEIVLALRPVHLLSHPDGEKIVAALGPLGTQAIESLEHLTGVKLAEIERLVVGWQIARDGSPVATLVVTTASPLKTSAENYQPEKEQGSVTVFGTPSALSEVRSLAGRTPPIARDIERALSHTDSSRDVTLMIRPRTMWSDASNLLVGPWSPLTPPLESIFGDNVAAAALSMNWDESFFVELVAIPTLDSPPEKTSAQLSQKINELPKHVEDFVLGLQSSPYGRRLIVRLPEMSRRLAAYTRHGFDRDAAVLRCYLPVAAGHNLIMAGELALAEGQGSVGVRAPAFPAAEAASPGIAEKLQAKTSLRFAREELEAALDMLSQDLGVPIVIRGPDLQADGITRNQLFAIDMADRTGEEILVEILRRANPDKLATGPADPRQKLVYVVGPGAIVITTRSQTVARGEQLPSAFSAE